MRAHGLRGSRPPTPQQRSSEQSVIRLAAAADSAPILPAGALLDGLDGLEDGRYCREHRRSRGGLLAAGGEHHDRGPRDPREFVDGARGEQAEPQDAQHLVLSEGARRAAVCGPAWTAGGARRGLIRRGGPSVWL